MTFNVQDAEGIHALHQNREELRADGWAVTDIGTGSCDVIINTGTLGSGENTLTVQSGTALLDGSETAISQQSVDVPLSSSEPRKDLVTLDSTGTAGVIQGTAEPIHPSGSTLEASERPAPPDLSGTDVVPLAIVLVPADSTSITSSELIDIRANGDVAAGTVTADVGDLFERLGIPVYSDDTNAPVESLYFYPGANLLKYKDSSGVVHEAGHVSTLSELGIDTNKDWQGFDISNTGTVSGSAVDMADRLGLPVYADATNAPADSLFFNSTKEIIEYKDSAGTLFGAPGSLSNLTIDADKNWQAYSVSNMDALETEFTTHSNSLSSDYTVPAGKGTVVAGELTGTGSISGDGSLAVIDEGIHDFIHNPVEADVDASGYNIANVGSFDSTTAAVGTFDADSVQITNSTPGVRLTGTETGAEDLTIRENAGAIELYDEGTGAVAGSWDLNPTLENASIAALDTSLAELRVDTSGNRPAAGTANRVFIETDTGTIYRDNGTSWDVMGTSNIADTDHSAADHEAGGSLEVTHNNLSLTASDHHTPSSSTRNLQPEGMQTGLAADVTGVQYSGEMYQYIDGALLSDSRAVYLEAATNSSAGDEDVTVEVYDPAGAAVLDSLVITGGSTRSRSTDISASLTADSEVQVRWNVTTASATSGATFDAVAARLVIE